MVEAANRTGPVYSSSKDRFHDATTTGALTSANARISDMSSYFDAADRMTASEDVGTNGGSAWTRPSSPDARDDNHLVTSYGYDDRGMQSSVTDPRGIVGKTEYDALGGENGTGPFQGRGIGPVPCPDPVC